MIHLFIAAAIVGQPFKLTAALAQLQSPKYTADDAKGIQAVLETIKGPEDSKIAALLLEANRFKKDIDLTASDGEPGTHEGYVTDVIIAAGLIQAASVRLAAREAGRSPPKEGPMFRDIDIVSFSIEATIQESRALANDITRMEAIKLKYKNHSAASYPMEFLLLEVYSSAARLGLAANSYGATARGSRSLWASARLRLDQAKALKDMYRRYYTVQ